MKKVTNKYKTEVSQVLMDIAGYSALGRTGRGGVKEKREQLMGLLFNPVSGKRTVASEKDIIAIASMANELIVHNDAFSSQVRQTLQRNVASACNLYLELWEMPECQVKITTKEISYKVHDLKKECRLKLLKQYANIVSKIEELAKTDKNINLDVAQEYYQAEKVKAGIKPLADEKVEIKAKQDAMDRAIFNHALELAVNG